MMDEGARKTTVGPGKYKHQLLGRRVQNHAMLVELIKA